MRGSLRLRLRGLLKRCRRGNSCARDRSAPPGLVRSVILVKPRDPRFQEVIYVLRDEAVADADCDREELLRQAREAARAETGSVLPSGSRLPLWPALLLLLGAVLILKLTGVF